MGQGVVKTALEALRRRMPHLSLLRLDGGFLAAKVLKYLVSQHVGFLTKAGPKLLSIRTLLERTRPEQWQSYDEDTRLCREWHSEFRKSIPYPGIDKCRPPWDNDW